jgi:hypothetical protein
MFDNNTYEYKKAIRAKACRTFGATIALDLFLEFIGFWDAREYSSANDIRTEAKDMHLYKVVSFMNQYTDV